MSSPPIQWYPGHIAKAERQLQEQLKKVDVVLEVRDARIPLSTQHPKLASWIGSKERVLVLNRMDMIPKPLHDQWLTWFQEEGEEPILTNANQGTGVNLVARAAKRVGDRVNQKRGDRGLLPRPVRAVVLGFPNVGKSALINRLLNRRVVESARRPGVTRQLRWVRISKDIELLDAPGVLPSQLKNQQAALKLAICDDIGQAAYDNQRITTALVDLLKDLYPNMASGVEGLRSRYDLDPLPITGESYLALLAEKSYNNDLERTARQILTDFRKGMLGTIPLELPPANT